MDKKDIFSSLGLSKNATRAYRALLSLGPANISHICRRAKMHRPAMYRAIDELRKDDLVSVVVRGKLQWYAAEPPHILLSRMEGQLERFRADVETLQKSFDKKPQKPVVKFIEGRSAIEKAYLDIPNTLQKGDTFYRYSSRDITNTSTRIRKPALEKYRKERDEKELERFVITNKPNLSLKQPKLERAVKVIPEDFDLFDHDVTQIIYGNKILLIDYNSDTAIVIENAIMARFQIRVFQLLFKLLPGKSV